ncbi:hypothetical protein V6K52_01505 [Knoellia sp. S7-12]|uniref:hypothetical protein n=1 Tax=Knoellia sp. S7-12 TaxID=3126698 RepID=UPI00336937A0
MIPSIKSQLEEMSEEMQMSRTDDYSQRVWNAGQRQRKVRHVLGGLAAASTTVALVVLGASLFPLPDPGNQRVDPAVQSTPSDDVTARLGVVRAELAANPAWPQREIKAEDGRLLLPFSAGDPADYLAWLKQVGDRFDGGVRRVYTPAPGSPSQEELVFVREQLSRELLALDLKVPGSLGIEFEKGRVELRHETTTDPGYLAFLEEAQSTYGNRLHVQIADDPIGIFSSRTDSP